MELSPGISEGVNEAEFTIAQNVGPASSQPRQPRACLQHTFVILIREYRLDGCKLLLELCWFERSEDAHNLRTLDFSSFNGEQEECIQQPAVHAIVIGQQHAQFLQVFSLHVAAGVPREEARQCRRRISPGGQVVDEVAAEWSALRSIRQTERQQLDVGAPLVGVFGCIKEAVLLDVR